MSEHKVTITWERGPHKFDYQTYSRDHLWTFEGGVETPASAAPAYLGNAEKVDPEEAFVAALSSCHMLSFLAIAARKRFTVEAYTDEALGYMEKIDSGQFAITRVILRPDVAFGGERLPTPEQVNQMHHQAHEVCFIANSVKTNVLVEPAAGK